MRFSTKAVAGGYSPRCPGPGARYISTSRVGMWRRRQPGQPPRDSTDDSLGCLAAVSSAHLSLTLQPRENLPAFANSRYALCRTVSDLVDENSDSVAARSRRERRELWLLVRGCSPGSLFGGLSARCVVRARLMSVYMRNASGIHLRIRPISQHIIVLRLVSSFLMWVSFRCSQRWMEVS